MKRSLFILFDFLFWVSLLHGQSLVLDTLVVPLRFSQIPISVAIDSLRDERECDDLFLLDDGEITRFLFIPIDHKILGDCPVVEGIAHAFEWNASDSAKRVGLGLKHLDFSQEKHFLFYHRYHLYACMRVYSPETWMPLSEWIYDCHKSRWVKGISLRDRYKSLFHDFVVQLGNDLNAFHWPMSQNPHFRQTPWVQFLAYGEWTMISNGWMLDGSVDFLFPEIHSSFLRSSGVIRYRNERQLESIAWAIFSDSFFHRIYSQWVFRIQAQGFLGINRWKDIQKRSHTLYDIPIVDCSLASGLHFQPKIWRGPIFGCGIRGDVSYVYSLNFRLLSGFYIHLGWQL